MPRGGCTLSAIALVVCLFAPWPVAAQSPNEVQPDPAPTAPENAEAPNNSRTPDLARLLVARDASTLAEAIRSTTDWVWVETAIAAISEPQFSGLCADSGVSKAIAGRLAEAPAGSQVVFLTALGRSNERDAVRAVLGMLDQDLTPESRRRVFQVLVEQTGRSDLGEEVAAWQAWWNENEWIPEAEWLRRVTRWQSERSRRLVDRSRTAERGRAELYRELFSLTAPDARSAILIRMLGDGAIDVRRLGLELATRAVVNATPLPPEVSTAAAGLLRDPASEVRAGSAIFLASAGVNGAAADISQALTRERNALAAKAMLEALAFTIPTPGDLEVASSWLRNSVTTTAAARLLAVGAERGVLLSPRIRNMAWQLVESDCGASLGAAGIQLYGQLAPSSEFLNLMTLVRASDAAIRDAAAEALTSRQIGFSPLFAEVSRDPALLRFVVNGACAWSPTRVTWTQLTVIEGVTEQHLTRVADAMPPHETIATARIETSDARRIILLSRFSVERLRTETYAASVVVEGASLRMQTLLDLRRYEQILSERRPGANGAEPPVFPHQHTVRVALLCLERIDEATSAQATAEEWIEAIERLSEPNPEAAGRLALALQSQDGLGLSTAQAAQLDSLQQSLLDSTGRSESPTHDDME